MYLPAFYFHADQGTGIVNCTSVCLVVADTLMMMVVDGKKVHISHQVTTTDSEIFVALLLVIN